MCFVFVTIKLSESVGIKPDLIDVSATADHSAPNRTQSNVIFKQPA